MCKNEQASCRSSSGTIFFPFFFATAKVAEIVWVMVNDIMNATLQASDVTESKCNENYKQR